MKKFNSTCRKMAYTLSFTLFSLSTFAQSEISDLFKSNADDASKLIHAYMNPFFKGFGNGLNSGWNTSAATKKFGRFEIRVGLTGSLVPNKDKTFDVTKIGLSDNIGPANQANIISPTVGGEEVDGPVMNIYDNSQNVLTTFTLPQGANVPFVPAPQVQATVGLFKGIDATLRFVPKVKVGSDAGSIGMIGGGVKVDLIRFIAGKKTDKVIPFDLAASLGYTQINYKLPLDVQSDNSNYTDQRLDAKFSGYNLEAIISKKLLFFTPFLSVGYQSATSNVDLNGTFPFETGNNTYTEIINPISISDKSVNGLRTNVGFQMKLAVLQLYASYSLSAYKSFNAGIGFGIGK